MLCAYSWERYARGCSARRSPLAYTEPNGKQNYRRNMRERLVAANVVIPAKRGEATWWVQGYRVKIQTTFPSPFYIDTVRISGELLLRGETQVVGASSE